MTRKTLILSSFLLVLVLAVTAVLPAPTFANDSQTFVVSIDNVGQFPYSGSGVFNTPVGAAGPGPLLPGEAYEFTFYAAPGENVSFATMFVQSNDWFFAPNELGIPVYNADGSPNTGDVTRYLALWDAGTEGDEPLGTGANQAPRQAGLDTGSDDPNDNVRQVLSADVPPTSELIRATLISIGPNHFRLRLDNVSGSSATPTPFAPGTFVVHSNVAPLFVNGQPDYGYGLEAIAEDGSPARLAGNLAAHTGINTPLAPVAWTVHQSPNALFASGTRASAGLEMLAEDGSPVGLVGEQGDANTGAAAVGRGASGPAPIFAPDGNYTFTITAAPGDHLSLATMFVQSNDWFFGLNNLPLFDTEGKPRSGSITDYMMLYDAGTEVDEATGYGPNQAPRQAGPNTGAAENGIVTPVNSMGNGNIHVTITPVN